MSRSTTNVPTSKPSAWYADVLTSLGAIEQTISVKASKSEVRDLVDRVEREVRAAPERCFEHDDDGGATLVAAGRRFAAGRFEAPTLRELRARVDARPRSGTGRVQLSVLSGEHALTDIGTLQATAPSGTVFQVASQFNCLEAPNARVVPVADYVYDNTQGPRAAISAFPGALLRHYRAPGPGGERFVQSDARCLDLLEGVFDASVGKVRSGYLSPDSVRDPDALAQALVERFDDVRVGVHDDVEVVFGHDWGGAVPDAPNRRIAQVLTSTLALGGYGHDGGSRGLIAARRQVLRAAYLGTLLATIALRRETVVLTKIGGGAFGNPEGEILDAILWAVGEVDSLVDGALRVIVNSRNGLDDAPHSQVRAQVRARGGAVVELGRERIVIGR